MTWPLVKPTAGYMTLSRLVSFRVRPATSTSRLVRAGATRRRLLRGVRRAALRAVGARLRSPRLAMPAPVNPHPAASDYVGDFAPQVAVDLPSACLVVVDLQYGLASRTAGLGRVLNTRG